MNRAQVKNFENPVAMSAETARLVRICADRSVNEKGFFTFAISGGKTPEPLFVLMADQEYSDTFPWERTSVFWVDERFVPDDDPDSNFGNARNILLSRINIPAQNIYKMAEDFSRTPADNALLYEKRVRSYFLCRKEEKISFDLMLLGMGDDGHTASLFPHSAALYDSERLVIPVTAPACAKPPVPRLSMTFPLINASAKIVFMISGPMKRMIAEKILSLEAKLPEFPAAGVRPEGELIWHIS